MPYIETVDDLAEWLADKCGIWNCGKEVGEHDEDCNCRICFIMDLKNRIINSVENTNMIGKK